MQTTLFRGRKHGGVEPGGGAPVGCRQRRNILRISLIAFVRLTNHKNNSYPKFISCQLSLIQELSDSEGFGQGPQTAGSGCHL
jgi:hypothetical protein